MKDTHTHHLIPRYEGGSDDPDNLIELSKTRHTMWHFAEWQRKGNKEDFIAWRALSGQINAKQIEEEVWKLAVERRAETRRGYITPESTKQKISGTLKGRPQPHNRCPMRAKKISDALKGVPKSMEHRESLSKVRRDKGLSIGERNPMFGKSAVKGRKWWINDMGETAYSYECPGPGWKRGRKR
jgi:hypothetical protein